MRWRSFIIIVLGSGACAVQPAHMPAPVLRQLHALLRDVSGDGAVRGAVRVNTLSQSAAAVAVMADGIPGVDYPWHIHPGACGSPAVVGEPVTYPPLHPDSVGRARAEVRLPLGLLPGQRYFADIHAPAPDTVVIACGELRLTRSP